MPLFELHTLYQTVSPVFLRLIERYESRIVETAALGHPQFEKHALQRLACSKILEHP